MSPLCTPRYQEAASRRAGNLRSGPPGLPMSHGHTPGSSGTAAGCAKKYKGKAQLSPQLLWGGVLWRCCGALK